MYEFAKLDAESAIAFKINEALKSNVIFAKIKIKFPFNHTALYSLK